MPIDLEGYIPVNQRIDRFYELYGQGSIVTEKVFVSSEPDNVPRVWAKALAYRTPDDPHPGVGWSWMVLPGSTNFTRGSELENTETSAWGRAIASLGILIDKSIASQNEVDNKRPDTGRLPADPHPSQVDRSTGEVRPQVETETLIGGPLRRTGKIAKGDGAGSDLQYRMGPEGHSLHFRLEIAGKNDDGTPKNIPQVWAEGELGETMFAAGIDPEKLKGEKASCTGLVYAVAFPGRRTFHRMKLSRIEVADLIIPPAEVSALRVVPDAPEAVPEPLRPEDVAELDALEVPWPDGVMA